ncbi:MAG: hypothetical protein OXC05_12560 [Halieaceae bacterium]|nr:hypothetical protein [Halieaceae bacterium]
MLYKLKSTDGRFNSIEPVEFSDFSSFENLEKDLENLIADNILETLYENESLMPIFQERQLQEEADVYALNENGELIIFELKRGTAGVDAMHQILRYAQDAGQWSYSTLQEKYRVYSGSPDAILNIVHKENFDLENRLDERQFNIRQHLIVIGSAADQSLMNAVKYWKDQGLSIDFLPYRVYQFGEDKYFEFFALPYDEHRNPADTKGVLFDTNRSWNEESIWFMLENSCVAAFEDAKRFVEYVYPGDIVFFSHRYQGLVAAAKVKGGAMRGQGTDTWFRDVEFITRVPKRNEELLAMPFKQVSQITGKSFYWARTIKVPYLSRADADRLAKELVGYLGPPSR